MLLAPPWYPSSVLPLHLLTPPCPGRSIGGRGETVGGRPRWGSNGYPSFGGSPGRAHGAGATRAGRRAIEGETPAGFITETGTWLGGRGGGSCVTDGTPYSPSPPLKTNPRMSDEPLAKRQVSSIFVCSNNARVIMTYGSSCRSVDWIRNRARQTTNVSFLSRFAGML